MDHTFDEASLWGLNSQQTSMPYYEEGITSQSSGDKNGERYSWYNEYTTSLIDGRNNQLGEKPTMQNSLSETESIYGSTLDMNQLSSPEGKPEINEGATPNGITTSTPKIKTKKKILVSTPDMKHGNSETLVMAPVKPLKKRKRRAADTDRAGGKKLNNEFPSPDEMEQSLIKSASSLPTNQVYQILTVEKKTEAFKDSTVENSHLTLKTASSENLTIIRGTKGITDSLYDGNNYEKFKDTKNFYLMTKGLKETKNQRQFLDFIIFTKSKSK